MKLAPLAVLGLIGSLAVTGYAEDSQILADQPPVVVATQPVSGARNVPPGEMEIRVRFSKPMMDNAWSWCTAWEDSTPQTLGQPHYEADQQTCVMKVKLEGGHTYAWWLNSAEFIGFGDTAGHPAIPYLLIFETAGRPVASTAITSRPTTREGRWLQDLAYFQAELPKRHLDFFELAPPDGFRHAVSNLQQNVTNFSDAEMVFGLMRIVAGLGVAHTQLGWQGSAVPFHHYPLQLRWCAEELAVFGAPNEYREALGARVLRIGTLTPEQLEQSLAAFISHENQPWLQEQSPSYMTLVELLQYLKVAHADGSLDLSLAKADGKPFALRVTPADFNDTGQNMIAVTDALQIPTPLYRQHRGTAYWREFLPESRTLYLQYSQCHDAPGMPFASFAAEAIAYAVTNSATRVVVDLRANAGGNSEVILPLLAELKRHPALSKPGHLYTLIGAHTFSSGMMDAMYLHDRLQAILVGGPTGGKPNSYGEVKQFTLPNSRLGIYYPVKHFRPLAQDDPPSVEPDLKVSLSLADFVAGRDPILAAALNHAMQ